MYVSRLFQLYGGAIFCSSSFKRSYLFDEYLYLFILLLEKYLLSLELLLVVLNCGLNHFLEGDDLPAHAALHSSTFLHLDLQMHLLAGLSKDQMPHLPRPLTHNSPCSRAQCIMGPRSQGQVLLA